MSEQDQTAGETTSEVDGEDTAEATETTDSTEGEDTAEDDTESGGPLGYGAPGGAVFE